MKQGAQNQQAEVGVLEMPDGKDNLPAAAKGF